MFNYRRIIFSTNTSTGMNIKFSVVSLLLSGLIILFSCELKSADNISFSHSRGFYTEPFQLTISGTDTIKYTLDGSDPAISPAAIKKTLPVIIEVNPDSTEGGRGKTAGFFVRVCSVSGSNVSETITHTYLFINKLAALSPDNVKPGPAWPNMAVNGQVINYGIDTQVVNDPKYKDLIDDAFLSIPSISIVTDLKNLFSPDSGIYVNSYQDTERWEREASVELLNPDSSKGFQIDAGLRIRGGASRDGNNPKHAFRLFFKKQYGYGSLKYPLFGSEGVKEFDKIDLRTSQNYSWSYPGHQGEYNTMNRDVFSRDLQRELGQPYTRSRYYHLYINGYYWGIYQTQERPDAHFAESYFGGIETEYDVVKPGDGWPADVIVTDGNNSAYKEIWDMCLIGFENNANYFKIQGLNPDGSLNHSFKQLIDVDNLIDYMLIIFFTGNFDAPISKFGQNNIPRNFFGVYNRVRKDGFKFFVHDAEHSIRTTSGEGPGVGLYENRVNLGSLPKSDSYRMSVSSLSRLHPQWIHFRLSANAEYRMRFADRAYKYFFNSGAFTAAKTVPLFLSRAVQIDTAIIAESARWGDTYSSPPRTKDKDWQKAVDDIVKNYFPKRPGIVVSQLKQESLYPKTVPPVIVNDEINISSSILNVAAGYTVGIFNPDTMGVIYYTTDNSDPRAIGGYVSSAANESVNGTELIVNSSVNITARVKSDSGWSPLNRVTLLVDGNTAGVKFTEILYNPIEADTTNNDYEFIELKNSGSSPADISNAFFEEGITYYFPQNTIVYPGQYIVLALDKGKFNLRYGFYPFGVYSGKFDNSGEKVLLKSSAGDTLSYVKYEVESPWPTQAANEGYSIVLKNDNIDDINNGDTWRASYNINGSPGKDDILSSLEQDKEIPTEYSLSQNYPNPFNPSTTISFGIPAAGKVSLTIYDILGREISKLIESQMNPGKYTITWNAAGISSGIYFYRLTSDSYSNTKKLMLLR